MATQGTFTAYQRLKPLEGDVSQDIQQQEDNGFKRRAEKRVEGQISQQKADKEKEDKLRFLDKYVKNGSVSPTGSKSLDEVNAKFLMEARKEYVPLMNIINNDNSSDEELTKAYLKLDKLNKIPETLTKFQKALVDRDLAIKKGVADLAIYANPEYDKNYQEGWGNKGMALDEDGEIVAYFINPDGSKDFESFSDVLNMKKYDFDQRFDRDKELLDASQKLQPEINQTDNGVQRTETTAINPQLLSEYVSNQLYEADGVTPTSKLKSFAKEAGVDISNSKALAKIAKGFENDIRLRVKGGTKVTRNYNSLDVQKEANDERARRRQEAKDDADKPKEDLGSENINRVGIVKGNQKIKDSAVEKANGATAYSVQGTNLERSIGKKGAYERVNTIYVLADGKTVVFDIDQVDGTIGNTTEGEAKTSNTTKISYRSDRNADKIADFITKKKNPKTGKFYKNVREFKQDALGIKEENTAIKQSTTKRTKIDY